jgi:hypothetical protein
VPTQSVLSEDEVRAQRAELETRLLEREVGSHGLVASTVTASKQWGQARAAHNDRKYQVTLICTEHHPLYRQLKSCASCDSPLKEAVLGHLLHNLESHAESNATCCAQARRHWLSSSPAAEQLPPPPPPPPQNAFVHMSAMERARFSCSKLEAILTKAQNAR